MNNIKTLLQVNDTAKSHSKQSSNCIVYSDLDEYQAVLYSGHYGIKLPLQGVESYYLEGRKFEVNHDQFLITNPEIKTEIVIDSPSSVTGLCIGMTKEFMLSLYAQKSDNLSGILQINSTKRDPLQVLHHSFSLRSDNSLSKLLSQIKYSYRNHGFVDYMQKEEFYFDLGEAIIDNQSETNSLIDLLHQSKSSNREEIFRRVDNMNQYIHENYCKQITLDVLANVACLSKFHAIRSYQTIYGIAPYQKIKELRLNKASTLLRKGYSISDVAHLCGYNDYRGFSKHFKKATGQTPSSYLKVRGMQNIESKSIS